jgi:hypothetical protein
MYALLLNSRGTPWAARVSNTPGSSIIKEQLLEGSEVIIVEQHLRVVHRRSCC